MLNPKDVKEDELKLNEYNEVALKKEDSTGCIDY